MSARLTSDGPAITAARQGARTKTRASAAPRATRPERAGEAAGERACGGVRGAQPLGV